MTRVRMTFWLMMLASWPASLSGAEPPRPTAEEHFVAKVLPVLQAKCFACHGNDPKDIAGRLDLRSREGAVKGGDSGQPVIVAGKPDESWLFIAVTRENADLVMPPKENDKLSQADVAAIRTWIVDGAPWPTESRIVELQKYSSWNQFEGVTVTTSGGLSPDWTSRRYKVADLWAYQPVPRLKPVKHDSVDHFIDADLSRLGLSPALPADRRTLIRRATFDLLGLPPTPDEIVAFVNDPASDDDAFARIVDRLLASPHYGEQMARHWLDVVRYADSSGFANDYDRGNAWRYRDYVVRAFNDDKPYDQFIREQVAGDEIDPANPEMLVAVGFLRMGPWELTGMEVPKVARQRFLDDVTNSVGETFLSHALQCARCHDHKFDPVPTRDYYSIQACFATTQLAERRATFLPQENMSGFEERKYLLARKQRYEQQLAELNERSITAARDWFAEKKIDPAEWESALEKVRAGATKGSKNRGDYEQTRAFLQRQGIAEERIPPRYLGYSPQDFGLDRVARKGLERLKWELERYEPFALSVYDGRTPDVKAVTAPLRLPQDALSAGELEETAILGGGDPFSPTLKVRPNVLSAVAGLSAEIPSGIEGRRAALADWIADARNPLTTRSIVNRIWLWHFGQPIAGNPNNFGATGKKPTHPKLLDWLAATFVEDGSSIKALHRRIMLSAAYRRSCEHPAREGLAQKDPLGTSYAVFQPSRLTPEELRDAMLRASGELNLTMGGIPVRPEINLEAALQPRQVMGTFAAAWTPNPSPEQRHRRSIYALKIRGLRDPFREVFNEPSPDLSCERRETSTVTPQVFSLFNAQSSYDRAAALAHRILMTKQDDNSAIQEIYRFALGRSPYPEEHRLALDHWRRMTARHEKLSFAKTDPPHEVIREAVEENTGEKFTFTERLDAYDDFVPDLKFSDLDARTRGLAEVCLLLFNSNEFIYVY